MPIVGALPYTLQNGTTADATQVMADFNLIKTDVNANAAAAGANNDITSLAGLTTPLSVAQGGSGSATPGPFVYAGGYRNIARRNGGLEMWQRGANGTASFAIAASASSPYTADGWYLRNGANQASVVSQVAGLTDGSRWAAKILRNAGQTGTGAMVFGFPLDYTELYPMLGQFVRLSFTAKGGADFSAAAGALEYQLVVGTGAPVKNSAGYTNQTLPLSGTATLTTTATRYQTSSSVFIPVTTRQAEVAVFAIPVGTAGADDSFYVDDVQMEIVPAATGYTASDFERLHFVETLLLCQRHYFKMFDPTDAPASSVGAGASLVGIAGKAGAAVQHLFMHWPVLMRIDPTVVTYNPNAAGAQVYDETASQSCTSTTVIFADTTGVLIDATGHASTAVGNQLEVHFTADAGI